MWQYVTVTTMIKVFLSFGTCTYNDMNIDKIMSSQYVFIFISTYFKSF